MDLPTVPVTSKRILIVENEDRVRKIIAKTLEIEGYTVHQAHDANQAVRYLQQIRPDLLISDIDMPAAQPSQNGMNFYQTVRNNPSWTAIPFIFITRHHNAQDIQRARELGVEDYLPKPIDPEILVRIVHARLLRSAELQIALIDQAYLETIEVLANTVEGRDPYTHGHIGRVSMYAQWLAEALGWPAEQLRTLAFGARLHDIGKIVVPDQILKKPGDLTAEEWEMMKQHPRAGGKILMGILHLKDALNYVLYHHERWDGSGYPHGLCGRDIPIEGRVLAIADVFDALTTARPYHPARPPSDLLTYLNLRSGTENDPHLVPIFIETMDQKLRI